MTKDAKEMLGCSLLAITLATAAFVGIWRYNEYDNQCLARVREEGRAAAAAGIPPEACPYSDSFGGYQRERKQWMQGWAEGKRGKQ